MALNLEEGVVDENEVEVGRCYAMPSGVNRRVVAIDEPVPGWKRVCLEKINGRAAGKREWESMQWFVGTAQPMPNIVR